MKPKQPPAYDVRFERGRFVLHARAKEARIDPSTRIGSGVIGFFLFLLGAGAITVFAFNLRAMGIPELILIICLPVVILFAAYGIELMGRAIVGRPWSGHFWRAVETWISTRIRFWHVALLVLVSVGIPAVVGWLRKDPSESELLMSLIAGFLHVTLHEAGHLAAAGAVGYRPRWLKAGPLTLRVDGPKPHFALNRSWILFFGGLAAYEPIGQTRGKDFLVVAAGPLTNLLLAAGALELWGWPNPSSGFAVFLRSFIGLGIAMVFFNLIPLPRTTDGFALDGRELVDLLRGRR